MSRWTRLVNVLRRRAIDRDFDDELRFHILQRVQLNLRAGMTQADAEADALSRFGDVERLKAKMRAERIVPWVALPLGGGVVAAAMAVAGLFVLIQSPRVYEVGGDVSAPVPIFTSGAGYTVAAREAKVQGVVRVACVVRPSGDCSDVAIVQSPDPAFGLDEQAMRAVRRWRFRPGNINGDAVPIRIHLDFTFALR